MANESIPSLKDQYKEMIMEDLRVKSNNNSTWLYMTEYQMELTMFACRELLNYIDKNGVDENFEKVKQTVIINASIAMMELVPWLFNENAASVSKEEISMLMTNTNKARTYVRLYFETLPARPALMKDSERIDLIKDFVSGK